MDENRSSDYDIIYGLGAAKALLWYFSDMKIINRVQIVEYNSSCC